MLEIVKKCSSSSHNKNISNYEKDKVPIEKFLKQGKSETDLYKTCEDCRIVDRKRGKKYEQKKKESIKNLLEKNELNSEFSICGYFSHESKSEYDRDKVPKKLFSRYPDDPDYTSNPYKNCIDCRKYERKKHEKVENKRSIKIVENHFYCSGCSKQRPLNELSEKIYGEGNNTRCIECQEKAKIYNKKHNKDLKTSYRKIQLEYILKYQASCQICKSIFLIPESGTNYCIELKTREENGDRCLDYKDKTYLVKDFLEKFVDLLELRILDFDHLSEKEQREKNLLLEEEIFIGKNGCVRSMNNEKEMRKEAKKCQILDCKCHIKVTISRELGIKCFTSNRRQKVEYVNNIKKKGCLICGFFEEEIIRFIEMDHINPDIKTDCLSHMVLYDNYSLKDVIDECKKCRPLCRFCHRIHSSWQIENGII